MSQKLDSKVAVIGIDIGKNSFHIVRAVLQQDQTMPSGRNALRQTGSELSRFRSACLDQAMASC